MPGPRVDDLVSADVPLLERIRLATPHLRNSEQKVAALLTREPQMVLGATMAAVAAAAEVSEPTVMRFAAGMGYSGFKALQLDLVRALAVGVPVTHSAIDAGDTVSELAGKMFDHTISSLDRTRKTFDADALSAAVDALVAARSIMWVGFGASNIIAQDAEQKATLFGVPCTAPVDAHQQFMAASMADPDTVVVAISNTGRTQSVIEVARQARSRGATVIALTGDRTPLVDHCDIAIIAKTFEDTEMFTPSVSRLAGLAVIDILATGVAVRRGPRHLDRIREMKKDLADFRKSH